MKKLRKMKKVFAFMLALTLVLGMSSVAFAEPNDDTPAPGSIDMASITIGKDYSIINDGTTSPTETFNFTITKSGVTDSQYTYSDMPMFDSTTFNIGFAQGEATLAGDTNSQNLALPTYSKVGIFTYKLEETADDTAGVTYDGRDLFLKVYVINNPDYDDEALEGAENSNKFIRYATLYEMRINEETEAEEIIKVEGFENNFDAGSLSVTKNVTGNMGDQLREFDIAVTLNAPDDKTIIAPVKYSGGGYTDQTVTFTGDEATLNLKIKHNDTITFSNLPYGTTWELAETDYSGEDYTTTITQEEGTIEAASFTSTITNDKEAEIDTGINLDNLPYIMIVVVAAGGLVGFTLRRRYTNNK